MKSRKPFPSESNILKMWLQKLSAFPPGNTFWKRSRRCGWDSFPSGHSDLKERNQCRMDFSSNLVLFKQKSKSLLFNAVPVGAQFLKAGSTFSSNASPKIKEIRKFYFCLSFYPLKLFSICATLTSFQIHLRFSQQLLSLSPQG